MPLDHIFLECEHERSYDGPRHICRAKNKVRLAIDLLLLPQPALNRSFCRIIKTTFIFGAVGTALLTPFYGVDAGIAYASGATAGALYLFLLSKKIDGIGAGYGVSNSTFSKIDSLASNLRLFVPVLLMGGLALRNSMASNTPLHGFSTLTREQFLGSILQAKKYLLPLYTY